MSKQKGAVLLSAVVVAAASFVLAQQQPGAGGPSLAALLNQRQQTLQELVDLARSNHEQGEGSLETLIAAESELLEARLDAATTPQERIAIRRSQLRLAVRLEEGVSALAENGDGAPTDVMKARVGRLNAQVELLREEQKQ
ncbi:hypothetical protein Pla175_32170 [Pirellulimonas nuda]|uniref:Uncharacterized protein n=1 Tax=Pirellulimonas nuda TaxID=2528009 RepID=A0A518DEB3_9BACT|nr:hypothetical protein [Pirellulimonas nuda]QDU89821.1 hypothetical protein Pla175_32170 [Pirellulimonas nuda]